MAIQTVTASFAAEETKAVTWPAMAGNFGIVLGATISVSLGPVSFHIPSTSRSPTGCTINASAPFYGTVELAIWDKP